MISFLRRLTKPLLAGAAKLQVKQLAIHLCYWESSGREERPGILLLYALKIPSKKHKLETSSFKEISETASLAHPSRQPRYQMLGTHAGELWSCTGRNVDFITALSEQM